MNLALAILFSMNAWWLIPSTDFEARSVQAPYRALRGVISLMIGVVYLIAWIGK